MKGRVRLGAVSYLNTRPLTYGLEGDEGFELAYDVPSACADALAAGRVDVGLIPVIEHARHGDGYRIAPGVALGCRGAVITVQLFYRGELNRIRRVAVDTSSRTSVALLTILLRERHGINPELVSAAPDLDAMLHRADAALLIGDPVLPLAVAGRQVAPGAADRRSLDLGQEWRQLTGLPFVFAFWAGAEGALSEEHVARLQRARAEGERHRAEIAAAFQRERAGSTALYERYLRDHMCYDLGPEQLAGLTEFYRLALGHGLIESTPSVRFYPPP